MANKRMTNQVPELWVWHCKALITITKIIMIMNHRISLEVKLPTIWTDEKAEVGRVREEKRREKKKEDQRRSEKRKSQKKEDAGARKDRKGRKSRLTAFFQWFVAPEGRKTRLAKAPGAEPSGWMTDEKLRNCTPLWRETHLEAKKIIKK